MGVASLALVLALAGLLGTAVLAAADRSPAPRRLDPALALVAGLVGLHALLLLFDLTGVPWRRAPLLLGWTGATTVAAALAGWRPDGFLRRLRRRRKPRMPPDAAPGFGPGDAIAAVALLAYASAAWSRWITIPDFIYHWGIKAKRYLLAEGIDYGFLADPLRLTDHPDYPSLVPALYAAIGIVRGAFHERAALLVSVAFFLVAWMSTRRAVAVVRLPRLAGQGTIALVALVLAAYGIGYRLAGAADWAIVAALLVALPALLAGSTEGAGNGGALRLGLAAALAAGAKIEGVPLAALLVAAGMADRAPGWARAGASGRRALGRDLLALTLPPLLVIVPWAVQNLRHGLFAAENSGPFEASRVPAMLAAGREVLGSPEWYGLPWLLALLPVAIVLPATRTAALVLLLQAAFYAWVYLTSPVDTSFFVLSSLPRLLFHLVPPLLVLLAVAAFGGSRGRAGGP